MEIRARSLTCSFPLPGRFGLALRRRRAVHEVSFRARAGEITALAGENGSGKSTTLRLLAGLLRPDSGEALLGGIPAARARARRGLGYSAEDDDFPPKLEVGSVLRLSAALAGFRGEARARACARVTSSLDLEKWLGVRAGRCSRGIRRRLSLALALLGDPTALLLDEPLSGLDPVARSRSIAAIRRAAAAGAAVVVSLHDPVAIQAMADRLVLRASGRVVRAGPISAFLPSGGEAAPGSDASPEANADWLADALRAAGAVSR